MLQFGKHNKNIYKYCAALGSSGTNNKGELVAIGIAARLLNETLLYDIDKLRDNNNDTIIPIHIFTDSNHAICIF